MNTILCLDSSPDCQLPAIQKLHEAAHSFSVIYVKNIEEAEILLETDECISIFLTTDIHPSILRKRKREIHIILFSNIEFYKISMMYNESNNSCPLTVIPRNLPNLEPLLTSLHLITSNSEFDTKTFFSTHFQKQTFFLAGATKEEICKEIEKTTDSILLSKFKAKMQASIAEELMMNAQKNHTEVTRSKLKISITCEYNQDLILLSMTDPYGSLSSSVFLEYVMKHPEKSGQKFIESKKTGAGLGFYKMIRSCHGLICCVQPGIQTKITSLFFTKIPLLKIEKQPRLVQYFIKK